MDTVLFHRVYDAGHLIEEVPFSDPLSVFAAVAREPYALLLDSATAGPHRDPKLQGRWTYIATDPFTVLTKQQGQTCLNGIAQNIDALELLHQQAAALSLTPDWPEEDGLPPFTGGFAGLFGYELGQELEHLPTVPQAETADTPPPDLALGAYDCILAFDCVEHRAFIVSTGLPETSPTARAVRAEARAAKWRARLALHPALPELRWPQAPAPDHAIHTEQTRDTYESKVQKVIDYIFAGDIFQANLSQRFDATLQHGDDAFTLYRKLRTISPAPFAGFFNFVHGYLLSSSPERFLKSDGKTVETKPIKGTRPRGATPEEDQALAGQLVNSEKDNAENVMIVDLLRNDLSRVSADGSVKITELCELESFATVHHLVSTIRSQLRPDKTGVDLLSACFPGGSITGAPKVRAMEIISELEGTTRGPYCGSLGFLSFSGAMDTNILIRSMTCIGENITFRAGGGIVADSNPSDEYEETLDKAAALADAIRGVPPKTTKLQQASA
ncbi:MAG: aminodeoxychorismate synthase component I [Rhodobiaceae bacterium]|nr:aminodeoxychorismate synthase component I [Rhodobiaceae bacterium]